MQFEIRTLDQCTCNELSTRQADQDNGYRIIWVQKGDGIFKIDLQSLMIKENVVYFLCPGQICVFGAEGKLEGYYIYLSPEFIHLLDRRSISSFFTPKYNSFTVRSIQPDLDLQKDLEDIMAKMLKEFSLFTPSKLEILIGLFNIFIIYLSNGLELIQLKERSDRGSELAGEFFDLLNNHYRTKKMVSEYASILYVSPNYLNRSVKKISGFAARYHIHQAIVVEAKRQAIYTGSSMKEIAYFLGFKDYAHFSKFFKNNSGVNFTSFKKERAT
ncbi:helix-turn-helix domain-containing protein [Pedobacter hiemivivus]|uniref:Helix-turn-helix domain-containing protein n=1 Tax=Pedobacter hiemivivus TaxID=2530454 RepID=A0A4U1GPY2_9SPHI|nr:helix-turn-helix domain-containing protein [Pedobacter hiemivivus]TKC65200.1 helix-turn-helix domain-containing protein [Pedobacter hiemivivus]